MPIFSRLSFLPAQRAFSFLSPTDGLNYPFHARFYESVHWIGLVSTSFLFSFCLFCGIRGKRFHTRRFVVVFYCQLDMDYGSKSKVLLGYHGFVFSLEFVFFSPSLSISGLFVSVTLDGHIGSDFGWVWPFFVFHLVSGFVLTVAFLINCTHNVLLWKQLSLAFLLFFWAFFHGLDGPFPLSFFSLFFSRLYGSRNYNSFAGKKCWTAQNEGIWGE